MWQSANLQEKLSKMDSTRISRKAKTLCAGTILLAGCIGDGTHVAVEEPASPTGMVDVDLAAGPGFEPGLDQKDPEAIAAQFNPEDLVASLAAYPVINQPLPVDSPLPFETDVFTEELPESWTTLGGEFDVSPAREEELACLYVLWKQSDDKQGDFVLGADPNTYFFPDLASFETEMDRFRANGGYEIHHLVNPSETELVTWTEGVNQDGQKIVYWSGNTVGALGSRPDILTGGIFYEVIFNGHAAGRWGEDGNFYMFDVDPETGEATAWFNPTLVRGTSKEALVAGFVSIEKEQVSTQEPTPEFETTHVEDYLGIGDAVLTKVFQSEIYTGEPDNNDLIINNPREVILEGVPGRYSRTLIQNLIVESYSLYDVVFNRGEESEFSSSEIHLTLLTQNGPIDVIIRGQVGVGDTLYNVDEVIDLLEPGMSINITFSHFQQTDTMSLENFINFLESKFSEEELALKRFVAGSFGQSPVSWSSLNNLITNGGETPTDIFIGTIRLNE